MVIAQRVVADYRGDKITGNQHCSLVNKLVKSMLPVRARLSPYYRAGRIGYRNAVPVNAFAIALHIPLLEISCKAMHVLIIRKNCLCLGAKEVPVPDTDQGHDDRNIFFKSCILKMLICGMSAIQ